MVFNKLLQSRLIRRHLTCIRNSSPSSKGTTRDESMDGNDGLPGAEGTHGDQRHAQKGPGSRSGAGHRQTTDEEPKTRERPRKAKSKTRGQRFREIKNPRISDAPDCLRGRRILAAVQPGQLCDEPAARAAPRAAGRQAGRGCGRVPAKGTFPD